TAERRAYCWRTMDGLLSPGRYLLGEDLSVLDLYVTVVSRWAPGRVRFYQEAPKMAEVVRRVAEDPRLADFWAARFPFAAAWRPCGQAASPMAIWDRSRFNREEKSHGQIGPGK